MSEGTYSLSEIAAMLDNGTAPPEVFEALSNLKPAKRCTTWIRGTQCDHFALPDRDKCAMHAKPLRVVA